LKDLWITYKVTDLLLFLNDTIFFYI